MAPNPTPPHTTNRSSSSSSLPPLVDGTLDLDDKELRKDPSWNRVRVLVKHGALVVKDLLPVAHTITEKSYDVAKRGTKFGFDCAESCFDLTSQGMQMIGADKVADMVSTVADTVQGISKVTDANLTTNQRVACDSIASATSTLELIAAEDSRTRDIFSHTGLIDADTMGAIFAVFRIASEFAADGETVSLLEAPQLCKAVLALSQAQRMAKKVPLGNIIHLCDEKAQRQICRYARFALAAFRPEVLRFMGVDVPVGADDSMTEAIARFTGIQGGDVKKVEHGQKACQPAYFVAVDHEEKRIVVAFRGTLTMQDVLTDLVCESVALECTSWETGADPHAHKGMWEAACALSTQLSPCVNQLLRENEKYGIVLCGYSLGAGVATLLARLWRAEYPASTPVHCFAFAPPCSVSLDIAATMRPYVTSVVVGDDVVPRLSLSSAANLRDATLALKDDQDLVRRIAERAQEPEDNSDERKLWAQGVLDDVIANISPRRRFVPAGKILWVPQTHEGLDVVDADPGEFGEIMLTSSMILTHMPASYVKALQI